MTVSAMGTVVTPIVSTWTFWTVRTFDIAFWLIEEFAVADLDFALVIDADDDDFEGVADVDDVANLLDVIPGKASDVAKAIRIAEEVDEGAIILNAGDFAFEDLADFGFPDDVVDHGLGLLKDLFVLMIDGDGAIVFDVDLGLVAGSDDALDGFAAFADDFADLRGVNLEGDHLRSVFGDFWTWGWDAGFDGFADFGAGFISLGKGFL